MQSNIHKERRGISSCEGRAGGNEIGGGSKIDALSEETIDLQDWSSWFSIKEGEGKLVASGK